MEPIFKRYLLLFLVLICATSTNPVLPWVAATQQSQAAEEECATREECEKLLKQYERLLVQYEADVQRTATEKKTLQNQIAYLKKRTDGLAVQIKKSNAVISDLKIQITDTEKSVEETSNEIVRSQGHLASILRTINEEDQKALIEILLGERELSDFFDNMVYLENLNGRSKEVLKDIRNLKSYLEEQKQGLQNEKGSLEKEVKIQILQKEEHEKTKTEQEQTLKLTEVEYQKSLQEKKATEQKVSQIKARIFEMAGLTTKAPNFGEAYEIAKGVEGITGVRAAFLLAILTQESRIGKNVGQCYLPKSEAENIKKRIMHPTRDVPAFLQITKEIGRDPYATQVSCPMSFGYGGAMGPAQFIPSTWMMYRDRVKAVLGRFADPWSIRDAFVAAALYVGDYGAKQQTYNGEWRAAMIYFSGSTNTRYRFYGDSVMAITQQYEKDIALIEGK